MTQTVPTRLSKQSPKQRKCRQRGAEEGGREDDAWCTRADFSVRNVVDFAFSYDKLIHLPRLHHQALVLPARSGTIRMSASQPSSLQSGRS